MCGIAGFLNIEGRVSKEIARGHLKSMADAISHRGPDSEGYYTDNNGYVGLSHRRLSIIDLSPTGAQPMTSQNQRWTLVFNGEIYNFEELRKTIELSSPDILWEGSSDTEVFLAGICLWGIEKTLVAVNGMFAVAIWDNREKQLTLARDRLGEKPLYYGWQGSNFLFGSELKALLAHPSMEKKLSPVAVRQYLSFSYVPAPLSIFENIYKLLPGHLITINASAGSCAAITSTPYWTLPPPLPIEASPDLIIDTLNNLLLDSVKLRMRADVSMGAFLSGGIDSSLIVSMMQAQSSQPIKTFSIGFKEAGFNESEYAKAVAEHIGTDHTELIVCAQDALNLIPLLPNIYDEPFADSSQIPTCLLSRLTREHVIVSLSGDGGDEIFGGYARYFMFNAMRPLLSVIPFPLRWILGSTLSTIPDFVWRGLTKLPLSILRALTPNRVQRLSYGLKQRSAHDYYRGAVMCWNPSDLGLAISSSDNIPFEKFNLEKDFCDPVLGMAHIDTLSYLPDDILVKVDRATMSVALEGRIPFLDHRVVEFAATIPRDLKIRGMTGKLILRQLLDRHVPQHLTDRPKQGFAIPIDQWLRAELRPWAEELLHNPGEAMSRLIDMQQVMFFWKKHLSGKDGYGQRLWTVLMLIAWCRCYQPI
jgi:asparagine synthase (glutamine-hydrolysing)